MRILLKGLGMMLDFLSNLITQTYSKSLMPSKSYLPLPSLRRTDGWFSVAGEKFYQLLKIAHALL